MNNTTNLVSRPYYQYFSRNCATPSCNSVVPPFITGQHCHTICEQCRSSGPSRKRKRNPVEGTSVAGPSDIGKQTGKMADNGVRLAGNEKCIPYQGRAQLIEALRDCFEAGPDVDFMGSYTVHDPEGNHKQRIQTITHEIWKATGYRFTVKDHPGLKGGYKTRLWCSQDEAHKPKSKAARVSSPDRPRVSSAGEIMAKRRYPCRSRLFISSRDAGQLPAAHFITVRMHHHLSHEPYYDTTVPAEVTQSIWERMGWSTLRNPHGSTTPATMIKDDDSDQDEAGCEPPEEGFHAQLDHDVPESPTGESARSEPAMSALLEPPPPTLHSEGYNQRMCAHIAHIRDFCDGLEYQLQFNDYRMLDVLEREGGSFLRLVEDCLRKEGRLNMSKAEAVSLDQSDATTGYIEADKDCL